MSRFTYQGRFSQWEPPPRAPWGGTLPRYDFAVAYVDPDSLPLDGLLEGLREALEEEGRSLALYPPSLGHPGLRQTIAEKLARHRGMAVSPDQVLLTSGSMQALVLLIEVFTDPGDILLTEEFFYVGTLRAMCRFRARIIGIATDGEGLCPDALEETLKDLHRQGKRPKFLYTIPTFQNPLGTEMSLERRREILRVARDYDLPVIEDDCYVDLRFEGEEVPAIHALDGGTGQVIYVGSLSKIVAPGVRLGWVVAPPEVMDRLLRAKMDAGTNHLAALAVNRYLQREMDGHIAELRAVLRAKRDTLLAALGEYFGPQATWNRPRGGMYVWVRLRPGVDASSLREKALQEGLGYYSGDLFSPEGKGRDCVRLCFAFPPLSDIPEGTRLLARFFQREGLL